MYNAPMLKRYALSIPITLRTRRRIALVWLAVAAVALFALLNDPPRSSEVQQTTCARADGGACIAFPRVSGDNLDGATLTFPQAFAGRLNLVVVPFDREQQTNAAQWLPVFQQLAAAHSDIRYYSIAALPNLNPAIRTLVTGGLNIAITDPQVRAVTVVAFLEDQPLFIRALGLSHAEAMVVLIVAQGGEILWQGIGDYTPQNASALQSAFSLLAGD